MMKREKLLSSCASFAPMIVLFIIILPLAIFINPELLPRFLGETSHISQYGYLDLEHYADLATGESITAQQTAFYPLWPYLIRTFNGLFGPNIYRTAIFLSGLIAILSMILSRYALHKLAANKTSALISFGLYVLSPMSVFLFVGYTESLFAAGTWILILLIIKILSLPDKCKYAYKINYFLLFSICACLGLIRPTLPQAIFSTIVTLFLTLKTAPDDNLIRRKKYIYISILIIAGFGFGYIVYGLVCLSNGFRFFEPFYVQKLWEKSFGIRPIYLLTSRSPLIDFMGLYYPFLLIVNSLRSFNASFGFLNILFSKNLPLTLIYPPLGFIYGILFKKLDSLKNAEASTELKREKINLNDKYFMDFRYLFWYCSFTAFSNSLICAFTQKLYLASLGRYVFGQPYFYIALSIFIGSKASESIKHPKIVYCLTILISCGMLLKNFVDFGNANLHV